MAQQMKLYHFEFESVIWKIHPDSTSDWLVVELRNEATQEVQFAAFQHEKLVWNGLQLEELWWINSVVLYKKILLIHQYDDSPFPSPAFLMGIGVESQAIQWVLDDMHFQALQENTLSAKPSKPQQEPPSLSYFDIHHGTEVKKVHNQPGSFTNKSIELPAIYSEDSEYFAIFQEFLKFRGLVQPQHHIEYLAYANSIILSTYHNREKQCIQVLYLFTKAGKLLNEYVLQQNVQGIAPNSFLVHHNRLWMLQEKNKLLLQLL